MFACTHQQILPSFHTYTVYTLHISLNHRKHLNLTLKSDTKQNNLPQTDVFKGNTQLSLPLAALGVAVRAMQQLVHNEEQLSGSASRCLECRNRCLGLCSLFQQVEHELVLGMVLQEKKLSNERYTLFEVKCPV